MSCLTTPARTVRRCLLERLERLHDALTNLARRLREGIASVIGAHVGDTVRDAIHAALNGGPRDPPQDDHGDDFPRRFSHGYPGDSYWQHDEEPTPSLDEQPGFWHNASPLPTRPVPTSAPSNRSRRWWSLLPAGFQALAWCLRHDRARRPVLTLLGIATLAGLIALLTGPVAGAAVATAGVVITLTGMADATRDAVGSLAETPVR
jgi:hypothetical protein